VLVVDRPHSILFRYQVSGAFFSSVARHFDYASLGLLGIIVLWIMLLFSLVSGLNLAAPGKHQASGGAFAVSICLTRTTEAFTRRVGSTSVSTLVLQKGPGMILSKFIHQLSGGVFSILSLNIVSDAVHPLSLNIGYQLRHIRHLRIEAACPRATPHLFSHVTEVNSC